MHLHAPHPASPARRPDLHRVAGGNASGGAHPGGDGARSVESERALHGQPEREARVRIAPRRERQLAERHAQLPDPLPAVCAGRQDGHLRPGGPCQERAHVVGDQLPHLGVGQVGLGQHHQTMPDAQEPEHLEVLPGLGHDPVVTGHHQHRGAHAGRAGHHLPHQLLVAGHVHEADLQSVLEHHFRIAQVQCDAAPLLFFPAIRVLARERLDQGALAVVDVTGRSDHHGDGGASFHLPGHRRIDRAEQSLE